MVAEHVDAHPHVAIHLFDAVPGAEILRCNRGVNRNAESRVPALGEEERGDVVIAGERLEIHEAHFAIGEAFGAIGADLRDDYDCRQNRLGSWLGAREQNESDAGGEESELSEVRLENGLGGIEQIKREKQRECAPADT